MTNGEKWFLLICWSVYAVAFAAGCMYPKFLWTIGLLVVIAVGIALVIFTVSTIRGKQNVKIPALEDSPSD